MGRLQYPIGYRPVHLHPRRCIALDYQGIGLAADLLDYHRSHRHLGQTTVWYPMGKHQHLFLMDCHRNHLRHGQRVV